jgi:hypothetical protein
MKPALWLRIAAVVTLLQAVLHTVGAVFGDPAPGPATVAVQAMRANQFVVMGHLRSYSDFFRALGLGVTISLTAEAIVFWQLSSMAKTDAWRLRPILVTFLVAYAALDVGDLLICGASDWGSFDCGLFGGWRLLGRGRRWGLIKGWLSGLEARGLAIKGERCY